MTLTISLKIKECLQKYKYLVANQQVELQIWFACVNIKSPAHATSRVFLCLAEFNSSPFHCPYLVSVRLAGLQVHHYEAVGGHILWLRHAIEGCVGAFVVLDDDAVGAVPPLEEPVPRDSD